MVSEEKNLRDRIRSRGETVLGVGSALTDILVRASDAFLFSISDIKGGMTLVDRPFLEKALSMVPPDIDIVPGGATCNAIQGIGRLGGKAAFIGKLGKGNTGKAFEESLKRSGVTPFLARSETRSGQVLAIITPDTQRSMFTFLGASSELKPDDLPDEAFEKAAIVLVEGYLFFNPDLAKSVLQKAHAAGAVIAMDLSSFTVVESTGELLHEEVRNYVDILIGNEDESIAYTGASNVREALRMMSLEASLAAVKCGAEGSFLRDTEKEWHIGAHPGDAVIDTTGAGDLWASGFLYGLTQGWSMDRCGALASACGYEVCGVIGAQIPEAGWARIRSNFLP
ncbi:adenosine kinase [Desulfococcaceae bacterium OttesenSCG-928-F15]|nr:adenosine kinase [Desulfococcaceae bacterium OttesenSCG-928-F15]